MRIPDYRAPRFTAQRVFTDREQPLEYFLTALKTAQGENEYRVLNFYGVGGIGKTRLCQHFAQHLPALRDEEYTVLSARVDFEDSQYRDALNVWYFMRQQLARGGMTFPAFDTAFARDFALRYPGVDIAQRYPGLFAQPNDTLNDLNDVLNDVLGNIPGVNLLYKYTNRLSQRLQRWWQQRGRQVLADLDGLAPDKLREKLPMFLAADIDYWLSELRRLRRVVIFYDTHEALARTQPNQSELASCRADEWLQTFVAQMPGVLHVVLGRDRLAWADHDADWAQVIDAHLLGDLSDADADKFLRQVPIEDATIRDAIVVAAGGVPFYLDLQVDVFEMLQQRGATPQATDFGGTQPQVLARFVSHLESRWQTALNTVSCARFCNEALFLHLKQSFPADMGAVSYSELRRFSFWKADEGRVFMHTLLREYLQEALHARNPAQFQAMHQALFSAYDATLHGLDQPIDLTPAHHQALAEAAYHLQQAAPQEYPQWINKQSDIFHRAAAWQTLLPLYQAACDLAQQHWGDAHPRLATALNNLAALHYAQGDYAQAEPLYRRALAILEQALGAAHPAVGNALNNLAGLLDAQGDYAQAEPLYRRALAIREQALGAAHPDVAQSLNNLALLHYAQGDYAQAEPLLRRALAILEQALGAAHPDVGNALNNLAELLRTQGDYAQAEPLDRGALAIREQALGAAHPDVGNALNDLAGLLDAQGDYAQAEPLLRRALAIVEQALGAAHPSTRTARGNWERLLREMKEKG